MPDFASFEFGAESMYNILYNLDIDEHGMSQAYMVCQRYGEHGVWELQSIVTNLLKNWSWIDNKSAFLSSSCVKFARHYEPRR